jgi:tetratricopeptide (TPR) repeat protein
MEPNDDFLSDYEDYFPEDEYLSNQLEMCRSYIDNGELFSMLEFIEDTVIECFESYEFDGLIEIIDAVLEAIPTHSEFWKIKGELLFFSTKSYEESERCMLRALELSPTDIDIYIRLAKIQSSLSKYEEALNTLNKAFNFAPNDSELMFYLGEIYDKLEQNDKAIYYLEESLRIDNFNNEVIVQLSKLYEKIGDFDKALRILDLIRPDENDILKFYNKHEIKGLLLSRQEKYLEAIEEFKECIKEEEYNLIAWSELGQIYASLGNYEEAVKAIKKCISYEYNSSDVYDVFELAECYKDWGKFNEALQYYNICILKKHEVANSHFNRGEIFFLQENYYKALIEYKKAIINDTEMISAYIKKADCEFNLGRINDAIASYKTAIEKGDNSYETWFKLGLSYLNFGELNRAIDYFDETIQRNPKFSYAYYEKAKALFNMKKNQEVVENLNYAIKYSPEIKNKLVNDFKDIKTNELFKQFFDKK